MTSEVIYNGNLRTHCTHLRSGDSFVTDAPVDNNGLGQAFSPTDTVATGLASCMLTMMGIKSRQLEISIDSAKAEILKVMAADPRRISRIEIAIKMPSGISEKHQKILENTARTCPVWYSLHPDIEKEVQFDWS